MDELVTIANYSTLEEAYIVKGMLESNGISTMVVNENNLYVPVFNWVRLLVRACDEKKAMELINGTRS